MKSLITRAKKRFSFGDISFSFIFYIFADAVIVALASIGALLIRFDFSASAASAAGMLTPIHKYLLIQIPLTLILFGATHMYHTILRYMGFREAVYIVIVCGLSSLLQYIGMLLLDIPFPSSYPFIYFILLTAMIGFMRYFIRFITMLNRIEAQNHSENIHNALIVGAGENGSNAARALRRDRNSDYRIMCFIDDDERKHGKYIEGIRVFGGFDKLDEAVTQFKIEIILVALPKSATKRLNDIVVKAHGLDCRVGMLPSFYQIASGERPVMRVRPVNIEDLLSREEIKTDMSQVASFISGKTVLVTGGGGSIGSELCRQLCTYHPDLIVIFDICENGAYEIQQELHRKMPAQRLEVLIGSVRDKARLDYIFKTYRPNVVFHAAAHKHVPLMEDSPGEAVKNNIFGTLNTAEAADRYKCARFVLISTDKAVRPTNVMGASKRVCEMIIQSFARRSSTVFTAVRFGNVIGSSGSVIPLFRHQIEEGGPVTVTDKEITRFFMTIPEAVTLVLQSAAFAETGSPKYLQGRIFILDMGKPQKIDEIARRMIRLSGFEPDVDIEVKYTGLRKGEKLYEELLLDEEGIDKTENDLIYIGKPTVIDDNALYAALDRLKNAEDADSREVRRSIAAIVDTYTYKEENEYSAAM